MANVGPDAPASVTNTATVASSTADPNAANDSSSVTTIVTPLAADLSITKTGPASVQVGQNITYTLAVSNSGPDPASNVTMTDVLPAGVTFVSATASAGTCTTVAGTVTCTVATLAPDGSVTFMLVVSTTAASQPSVTNTATVTSSTADPNAGNNSASVTTTVTALAADLSITKTGPPSVQEGQNISYTLTVTNGGPDTASNVSMSDTLPAGLTFVSLSAPAGWTCTTPPVGGTGTVTCTIATLASAGSGAFTLVANVTAGAPASITNTAAVASSTADPNAGNNSASVTTTVTGPAADLSITKTGPANVQIGQQITYTLTVTNSGPNAGSSVSMSDPLPAGLTFVSLSAPAGWTCTTPAAGSAGTVTCAIATLASGSSGTFTLVANVTAGAPPSVTNTATVASSTADPNAGNNSASVTTKPRRDPSQDPDVVGLVGSQVATAHRFAQTQISNFNERMESLHESGCGRDRLGISLGASERTPVNAMVVKTPLPSSLSSGGDAGWSETGVSASAKGNERAARHPALAPAHAIPCRPLAVWSTGYVNFGNTSNLPQASAYQFTTAGVSGGVDLRVNDYFTAGAGFGYGHDSTDIGSRGTKSLATTYTAALYGSFRPVSHIFIDGLLGFGALKFDSQRFDTGNADFAIGNRDGRQVFGSISAGYEHRWNRFLWSPYGRIKGNWLTLDPFIETGAGTGALSYSGQSSSIVTAVLGFRGKVDFLTHWGIVSPRVRAEYNHAFQSSSTASLQFADWLNGPTYTVAVDPTKSDYLTLGVGTDFSFANGFLLAIDYQTATAFLDTQTHQFKLLLGRSF